MKKFAVATVIALASMVGSAASAEQACMKVTGTFLSSCKDIQVTGPGCASRSSTSWYYGYEVKAVCKNNQGQYVQYFPLPISTNDGSGGGLPKIQKQTCFQVENRNGYLYCTK